MTCSVRTVAVLGTGTMGAPIARKLLRAGFDVLVWNRTPVEAAGLVAAGAHQVSSIAAAASAADVLITTLADGAAVEQVMTRPGGALSALAPGAIWIQMSTVGLEYCARLAYLAIRNNILFIDAPVVGSSGPAGAGELLIPASGVRPVRPLVEPIFRALGQRTLWLERIGDGSRLGIALSNWLSLMVEGMAETLTLSAAFGIDPQQLLNAVAGGPLASE
ncbi:NAD(P)-dependent oxidoreductase [Nocardia sp. NBC_00565]|uniref:NAD(P)-dependent oxidoreductase n=1 Tax=Nocardia sp. NBC_00565 TaxID=2975993 RepID=UPI002E81BEAB|nr:NAD(P)-dependent oxidoreductase [Nocardia sp. NBC_00565]WUC06559.1 NAD(P)-dependent oxidoreductase [Nocardia sp. NBC_00565]